MLSGERFRKADVVHQERSFFGVLRVINSDTGKAPAYVLRHGTTLHGLQFTGSNLRLLPTAYYGSAGGIGRTLQGAARGGPMRVGVIGLGVGTLAAYGQPGDLYRFYEIDPAVISLAHGSEFFSFLSDSQAEIEIVEADGRLALEDEQRRGEPGWDVLVIDAFSSDAVPVHLLTREAIALYARRLAPGGIIAIHVSNRHLALTELSFRLARSSGLAAAELRTGSAPRFTTVPSRWVVIAHESERLESLLSSVVSASRSLRLPSDHVSLALPARFTSDGVPVWTDDYSDLLSILRPPQG
jgi:spermidine synthase